MPATVAATYHKNNTGSRVFIEPPEVMNKLIQTGMVRGTRDTSVILTGSFLGGAMLSVGGALLIMTGGGVAPDVAQNIPGEWGCCVL